MGWCVFLQVSDKFMWCPERTEKSVGPPGNGVTGGSGLFYLGSGTELQNSGRAASSATNHPQSVTLDFLFQALFLEKT